MEYRLLGNTGLKVSRLSFGASSLGGVFHPVEETQAIRAVHVALDLGVNYFDVAPAYGGTIAETVLGKALQGIPRTSYFLSTKVGKYTNPARYGEDIFDYSQQRIVQSLEESAARLGMNYFDIVHLHDFEYQNRTHTDWALDEGLSTLQALKRDGAIGAVSAGIYPIDLWQHLFRSCEIDAALVHNHYCLNDTRLLELLPIAQRRGIGLINASPFASGLLTDQGPAAWHPATPAERSVFRQAADFCRLHGASISKLALQFSSQHPDIPTTMFSSSNPQAVQRNICWHEEPLDQRLLAGVLDVLSPVRNVDWNY